MGLFSHLNVFHAITRAVGIPDKAATIVADVLPVTALLGAKPYGTNLFGSLDHIITGQLGSHSTTQLPQEQFLSFNSPSPTNSYSTQLYQPSTGFSPDSSLLNVPDIGYGGPQPWDFSTASPGYLTQVPSQPQIYSGIQDSSQTSWEDSTISVAASLAPLFL